MNNLDDKQFEAWLDTLKKAWETKDSDLAVRLFEEDAHYYATPFRKPMDGKEEIYKYWSEGTEVQEDIKFAYQILAVNNDFCLAHTWGSMVQDKQSESWDGIFQIILNKEGKCTTFREWWVTKPND